MKAPRLYLAMFANLLVLSSLMGCAKRVPEGFGLAFKELERLQLCLDFDKTRSLVGPSMAVPTLMDGVDDGDVEVWVSKVLRESEEGRPEYIRPEMANKMGAYPFAFRSYKPKFRAAFLVVGKAGANFTAERLHLAIQSGKPLKGCNSKK